MFCSNCGTRIPEGSQFCPNCGTRIAEAPVQPAPQPKPVPQPQSQPQPVNAVPAAPVKTKKAKRGKEMDETEWILLMDESGIGELSR